jgi:hypothetical protein
VANLVSGVGLVASTALFWRSAVSRPPLDRSPRRSSTRLRSEPNSLAVARGAAVLAAARNELRQRPW